MRFIVSILAAGLITAAYAADGDPLKIKPIETRAGGNSKIDRPMVRMIDTQAKWQELWNLHTGAEAVVSDSGVLTFPKAAPAPTVDFAKNQVLRRFGGKLPNVQAYDYVKTYAKDAVAVVQLRQNIVPTSAASAIMTPFVLLVVPKEPVPIESNSTASQMTVPISG